ncbi:MAG: efflux RND transporter permease subunit [Desulfotignum sp.]|jgi:multidrug efflux pump subunit AcrB|nr:efflux RND transporter permease subunit [Desulfotignum sp.]
MEPLGLAGRFANRLLDSPLVPLFIIACFILGGYSLLVTPREDRPNIDVPTALVMIPWPGGGVERVDEQLARRAGTWIQQLSSVTKIHSSSTDHAALLTVEFEPGTVKATAFAELEELFNVYADRLPVAAGPPCIETFGEERLVMFMATLSSKTHSPRQLERVAGEICARLESVRGVRSITRHGGDEQAIEVLPRLQEMAVHGISLNQVAEAIAVAGRQIPVGFLESAPVAAIQAGTDISTHKKLARIPVGRGPAGPVYLEDVADIRNGTVHRNQAVLNWQQGQSAAFPAVTVAVTTLAGNNVSDVTRRLRERMAEIKSEMVPAPMKFAISYDAGKEATERVYNVLGQLLSGTLIVVGIIWLGLGFRAAAIIAMMMPASLAIVPFIYNQMGFTLNPVSIAAMILAIGILSDDAVVMLENVTRQFRKAGKKSRDLTVTAVNEVGNPTILADLLVVATLLPTAYITGEMGQYIRALPVGTSAAVIFSLLVALTITPYFGLRLLKVDTSLRSKHPSYNGLQEKKQTENRYYRFYRAMMGPMMTHAILRWILYLGLLILLVASFSLVGLRWVQIGLTPLLNRQVFVVEVELPAGATLTETLTATSAVSRELRKISEVKSLTMYAGTTAPFIYPPSGIQIPRQLPPHRASVHVEMVPKQVRDRLSYEVSRQVLHQLRDWLAPYNAKGYIGRIPSGPASDRNITAEIYGPNADARQEMADRIENLLTSQPGVVNTEQIPGNPLDVLNLWVDPQRAAIRGVTPAEVTRTLHLAVNGRIVTNWAVPSSREPVPVILRLDKPLRDNAQALKAIYIPGINGHPVSLEDLVDFKWQPGNQVRYRRNMVPFNTVVADLDQSVVQPLTIQLAVSKNLTTEAGSEQSAVRWLSPPVNTAQPKLYWSGKWEMTRNVYRDLGTAGAVVMLLIYLLLAGWFSSYTLPFLIMLPIPLIFIGVIPAHWLLGLNIVGTGVLGIIALAGIVARNSILLVDFIKLREKAGMQLKEAVLQAGIQRTRPILLTAATVMFGSGVLVFEPSLKPLGLTLVSGVLISTLLTLVLIPVFYYHTHNKKKK